MLLTYAYALNETKISPLLALHLHTQKRNAAAAHLLLAAAHLLRKRTELATCALATGQTGSTSVASTMLCTYCSPIS